MNKNSNKSIFFLINTRSGGMRASKIFSDLKAYAVKSNNLIEVEELSFENIKAQIAKASNYDILVLGGGDGTVSRLLGMLQDAKCAIAVLPLGTGNDLAKELKLTKSAIYKNPADLLDFYQTAPTKQVTLGKLEYGADFSNFIYFINYVSFGFDAKVVAAFDCLRKAKAWNLFRGVWGNRLGYFGLSLLHSFRYLSRGHDFRLTFNQQVLELTNIKSLIFSNIKSIMGLGISCPNSSPYDDKLEGTAVRNLLNYTTMLTHYLLPIAHPQALGSSTNWEISNLDKNICIQVDGEPRPDLVSDKFRVSTSGAIAMIVTASDQSNQPSASVQKLQR